MKTINQNFEQMKDKVLKTREEEGIFSIRLNLVGMWELSFTDQGDVFVLSDDDTGHAVNFESVELVLGEIKKLGGLGFTTQIDTDNL